MELFKRKTEQEKPQLKPGAFGKHFKLNPPKMHDIFDDDYGTAVSCINNIYIQAVDNIESKLVDKIVEIAQENGVTDAFILDKKNIVAALNKAIPVNRMIDSSNIMSCPKCGYHIPHATNMYCGNCGQSFVPCLEVKGDD